MMKRRILLALALAGAIGCSPARPSGHRVGTDIHFPPSSTGSGANSGSGIVDGGVISPLAGVGSLANPLHIVDGGIQDPSNVKITGGTISNTTLDGTDAGTFAANMTKIQTLNGFTEYSTTLGGAAQTINVTGLNGDADGDYRVECNMLSAAGTNVLEFEPNVTATNLHEAVADFITGATFTTDWSISHNGGTIKFASGDVIHAAGLFYARTGKVRVLRLWITITSGGTLNNAVNLYAEFTDTSTNITSFQAFSTLSSGLSSGSWCRLTAMQTTAL